jgi:hypothetical protein
MLIEKDGIPSYYLARYTTVKASLEVLAELQPEIDALADAANEKHKEEAVPEGWPMRKGVIVNRPMTYVLGKHVEDKDVEDVVIESEGACVEVKVVQEVTQVLESNPTGEFNLSITHKHRKVGSYQSISYQNELLNQEHTRFLNRQRQQEEA